jgi:hydrogenase expression/formation protein HypC
VCLGVPGKILEISGQDAVVEIDGVRINARTDLTPDAAVGDYGLVHAGYIIQRIDEQEAQRTLQLLAELAEFSREIDEVR